MAQAEYQRCTDKFFVNPYTFVDIDRNTKKVADAEEFYQKEELHTGYLECKLVTRTPLGIPDDERKQVDDEKHASYPFFSACGAHPLIPGSSLRGVVRSVYETVSDSCLSTMQENTGLSFRVGVTDAYDPGLLIREKEADGEAQWRLYKAKKYLIPCKGRGYKSLEGVPCFRVENADGKRVIRYKGRASQEKRQPDLGRGGRIYTAGHNGGGVYLYWRKFLEEAWRRDFQEGGAVRRQ